MLYCWIGIFNGAYVFPATTANKLDEITFLNLKNTLILDF